MNNRVVFAVSALGLAGALFGAWFFRVESNAQPPVFHPAPNPYASGIYANGIVESYQSNGANINIYPDVSGAIRRILVNEGDDVAAGTALLAIDDTVQRAVAEQEKSTAQAALAQLQMLQAQPRREALAVLEAQLDLAGANLKTARDQLDKQRRAYAIDPRAVSQEVLDNAANAVAAAQAGREVAQRQYDLSRAGAWSYDIANQQRLYEAATRAWQGASALLDRFTVRAPVDGVVLALNAAVGSYVSPQGVYDTYTQGVKPLLVMGARQDYMAVRCYIDEILISRIPPPGHIQAQMSLRGTDVRVPLEFVRVQPYVSPKIVLSDQRQERVDLRVLPLIFRFRYQRDLHVFPGQMVDVYVGAK